jgi:hypothetical protein
VVSTISGRSRAGRQHPLAFGEVLDDPDRYNHCAAHDPPERLASPELLDGSAHEELVIATFTGVPLSAQRI